MSQERNFELEEQTREEILALKHLSLRFAELDLENPDELLSFLRIKYNNSELADWIWWWLDDLNYCDEFNIRLNRFFDEEDYTSESLLYFSLNRHHLSHLQSEIKKIIEALHEYQLWGEQHVKQQKIKGEPIFPPPFPYFHLEPLLQKLNQMSFGVISLYDDTLTRKKDEINYSDFRVGIQLTPTNFEQIIYQNLMQHINDKHLFIQCSCCKKTIINPSGQQLAKYKITGNATHKHCRELYKSKKSTERKKKWRERNKQQPISTTKEEN